MSSSLGEKIRLLRGLWSREFAYAGPFAITVDVTRRCNLRCAGCQSHSPHVDNREFREAAVKDLDIDMFAGLCRELKAMGTYSLTLCGQGEPLLHPRLLDLIRLGKAAGFRTALITNGTLLDRATAEGLVDSGLDVARVSLWTSSREGYGANYPGTNARWFEETVNGLALLCSVKRSRAGAVPRVVLHTVINRANWREVDSFIDLAVRTRVDVMSFAPLHTLYGQVASLALSREEESALKESLRRASARLRSCGVDHNIGEALRRYEIGEDVRRRIGCYIAWTHPRIRVDGAVLPCGPCDYPTGNIRERSFREIWNGPAYRSFRKNLLAQEETSPIDKHCDCSFCCHLTDNARIHRFYKWVLPLARMRRI